MIRVAGIDGLRVFAAEFVAARGEEVRESEELVFPDLVVNGSLIAPHLVSFFSDLYGKFNIHLVLLEFSE